MAIHLPNVVKQEITLEGRVRADAWVVLCTCGYASTPHLTPKVAEREMAAHVKCAAQEREALERAER